MEFILIIFFISAPIFWLYGIISFLRNFNSKKTSPEQINDTSLLQTIVSDLEAIRKKETTLAAILTKYKTLLNQKLSQQGSTDLPNSILEFNQKNSGLAQTSTTYVPAEVEVANEKPAVPVSTSLENWWDHWYQENNINLLLYIGTFLIISSAAIFVGFNWETFSGPLKSTILTIITALFFIAGLFFYKEMPKLKNAGSTFLAIGALLIPFNGLAWYNFALRGNVSFATVWLATSVISVIVYLGLAYFIRNRFYTYIAGLGGLSLVESMVSVTGLNSKFYILGGIFSSFSLLAGSKIIAQTRREDFDRIYTQPLSISSNIFMPIFLGWGLMVAFSTHQLFTPEVVISTFLASAYYFLSYLISKNISLFTLGELLLTLGFVLLTLTTGYSGAPVFCVIFVNAFLLQVIAYPLKRAGKREEAYYSVFVATFIALLGLAISFIDPLISAEQRYYFTLIVAVLASVSALLERAPTYLYISLSAVNIAAYLFVTSVVHRTDLFATLGLFYLLFGSLLYLTNRYLERKPNWSQPLLHISAINLIIGVMFTTSDPVFIVYGALTIALAASFSQFLFKGKDYLYSHLTATIVSLIAVGFAFVLPDSTKEQRLYFTVTATALSALATYIERNPKYIYVGIFGLNLISYTVLKEFMIVPDLLKYLSLVYLVEGGLLFTLGIFLYKKFPVWAETILLSSLINFGLSLILSISFPGYALFVSAVLVFVAGFSAFYFSKNEFLFVSSALTVYLTFNLLKLLKIDFDFYPLAFSAVGVILYLTNFSLSKAEFKETLKNSGLAIAITVPAIFGIYSFGQNGYLQNQYLELSSLITAYVATAVLAFEAQSSRRSSVGYLASAVGLLTILWQYHYLGITIFQVYAVTTGLYFMALSYIKRVGGNKEAQQTFDWIGLLILLVPLTYQAFPDSGFLYAFQLGFEGLLLIGYGFSTNYKTYTYVGSAATALATLSRIYSFVASLGSWAIIGAGGLIFLAIAIFLLNNRKQE